MVEPQPPNDQSEHQLDHEDWLHDGERANVKRHSVEHEAHQERDPPEQPHRLPGQEDDQLQRFGPLGRPVARDVLSDEIAGIGQSGQQGENFTHGKGPLPRGTVLPEFDSTYFRVGQSGQPGSIAAGSGLSPLPTVPLARDPGATPLTWGGCQQLVGHGGGRRVG